VGGEADGARSGWATGVERRPADPPFPAAVRLLGRARPLFAGRRTPHAERRLFLAVIAAAAQKLEAEHAAGRLTRADLRYLGALEAFALGRGRSGQHRGVFIVGLADVRATQDPQYWTSALVHDGVHAWLQRRGRPYRDEVAPCEAQLDYLARTGADPALIAHIARFRDGRARQRRRSREGV
jgi:hypothetical protein